MKDYVLQITSAKSLRQDKLNIMREYLQTYILSILQKQNFFNDTAFLGGTALRFLFDLPRYSEDLDFSRISHVALNFPNLLSSVKNELTLAGYNVEIKYKDSKTVLSASVKFENILFETNISNIPGQKFSISLEIDTNPPEGAVIKNTIINKYIPIALTHYDITSLFSGKINALLTRKYCKGRDYFDLFWYLSKFKDIEPNYILLNNSLSQFGKKKGIINVANWRPFISQHIEKQNWNEILKDVVNLIENEQHLYAFSKENLIKLLIRG